MYFSLLLPCLLAARSELITGQTDKNLINPDDGNRTVNPTSTAPTLPTTATITTTTTTPATDCSNFNWNVTSDTVIILDTSLSVGQKSFEATRAFFRDLMAYTAVLRPDFTRLAVITFAGDAVRELDFIAGDFLQVPECELFSPGGLWEKRLSWTGDKTGENLEDALTEALKILKIGGQRRSGQAQRVWVASDLKKIDLENTLVLDKLKEVADVYGVGHGSEHDANETALFKTYVSQPADCFYNTLDTWKLLILTETFTTPDLKRDPAGDPNGEWVAYVEPVESGCASCNGACQCREFSRNYGKTPANPCIVDMSAEDDDDDDDNDDGMWKWVIIGAVVGSLVVLVLVVALCCIVRACKKRINGKDHPTPFPTLHETLGTNTTNSLPRSPSSTSKTSQCTDITQITTISAQLDSSTPNNSLLLTNSLNHQYAPDLFPPSSSPPTFPRSCPNLQDNIYENGIVPEIIREHMLSSTMSRINRPTPAPALPPRMATSQMHHAPFQSSLLTPQSQTLPIPFAGSGLRAISTTNSRMPQYLEVLADEDPRSFRTLPLPALPKEGSSTSTSTSTKFSSLGKVAEDQQSSKHSSDASCAYEHVLDIRGPRTHGSRQHGSCGSSEGEQDYLQMDGSCRMNQMYGMTTAETQTGSITSRLRDFSRSISSVFGAGRNSTKSTASTGSYLNANMAPGFPRQQTMPAPKAEKKKAQKVVAPKRFQGNATEGGKTPKRNSAKFGTVRFKATLSRFNRAEGDEQQEQQQEHCTQNVYVDEQTLAQQHSP